VLGRNYDDKLSRFDRIPEGDGQTDGLTERQTDRTAYIYIARQCADAR